MYIDIYITIFLECYRYHNISVKYKAIDVLILKAKGNLYSYISVYVTIHKIVVYITCFKYIDIYSSHSIDMVNGKKLSRNCIYLQNTFHLIRMLIYVIYNIKLKTLSGCIMVTAYLSLKP